MRKRILSVVLTMLVLLPVMAVNPISGLLERIDPGASKKIIVYKVPNSSKNHDVDFFELEQKGNKPVVRGNSWVSIAVGINWYLKYYCGVQLCWNQMQAKLPATLPPVTKKEYHETNLTLRYDFNYCTFSYSMPFWDWSRWQQEIDWMALHGINMPLAAVGNECVWRNMMLRMGYSEEQVGKFIAGPAFLAWWEMNNLEGWGGPLPLNWYAQQEKLQKQILRRMKEYGMHPVLPGYCGMIPSFDVEAELEESGESSSSGESNQSSLNLWNGFTRPGILMPDDPRFSEMARLFYEETRKLYGIADYYSMDPFHEASNLPSDLNFGEAGKAIMAAMKSANSDAKWVVQGWTENPREEMLAAIEPGDLLILDLFSECRPMWGIPSIWQREKGYGEHPWLFCLLENFGANVGLHGRMDQLLENFYQTRSNPLAKHLQGIGLTMEGIETNPVMYELMCELPWRSEQVTKESWIRNYVAARYGLTSLLPPPVMTKDGEGPTESLFRAWDVLVNGIYNCPRGNNQQGPHESVFCSRPSLDCFQASSWSKMANYYDPSSTLEAALCMVEVADHFQENENFQYDLVDICRQAIADQARIVYNRVVADFKSFDRNSFKRNSMEFLDLLLAQDRLLATRSEFRVGRWIKQARDKGSTIEEKNQYEWNARVQITTWGDRYCANTGGLRDYAHKEWNGLLKDFYYPRWQKYFQILQDELDGKLPVMPVGNSSTPVKGNPAAEIDWYAIEEPWTLSHSTYSAEPDGNSVAVAKEIMARWSVR